MDLRIVSKSQTPLIPPWRDYRKQRKCCNSWSLNLNLSTKIFSYTNGKLLSSQRTSARSETPVTCSNSHYEHVKGLIKNG